MWYWRRMELISWTDRVGNEEVLETADEEREILQTIKLRKDRGKDGIDRTRKET
jgi:hypothetical protein